MEQNNNKIRFSNIQDGDTFQVGSVEFIKFPDVGGKTPAVTRDILFSSRFGDSNNLAESDVLKKLERDFLPGIIEAVGEENVCTFQTDLTTMDGLKPYAEMTSRVSLPTFDFYRSNVEIFDKYKVNRWWWLATPESARPHDTPDWVVCVSPSGSFDYDCFDDDYIGVRPFLFFDSSIFGSSAE